MQNLRFPSPANILCEILASVGYKARIVGGYVRDILQGLIPYEIDMATDASPDVILNICKQYNIKCIPTGIQHGTVTAIIRGETIEITTLRRDVMCDGRHAEVIFTDNWEEDAKRRDFTMNAIYLDNNLQLYDFFGGQKDLHENIVRFIGNPEQRIHEDYLRIMRYFRFLGYFENLNLHPKSFDVAVMLSHNLSKISRERIHSELLKIFSSRVSNIPIKLMLECGIFQIIGLNFSNINIDKLYFGKNALINLSIMMYLSDIQDTAILKKLKFSNAEQRLISELLKYKLDNHFKILFEKMTLGIDTTLDIEKVMHTIGRHIYCQLFEFHFGIYIKSLTDDDYSQILVNFLSIIDSITLAEFPVTADDIINLGYIGSDIGHKLRLAKQLWIETDCKLEKNLLIKLIQA